MKGFVVSKHTTKLLRSLAQLRFKLLGLATIKDIPTERFNALLAELRSSGWKETDNYDGFDAWIDYGKIRLRKAGVRLTLEWDNWTEGSIEGPSAFIETFARERKLVVTHEWRWAEYDEAG